MKLEGHNPVGNGGPLRALGSVSVLVHPGKGAASPYSHPDVGRERDSHLPTGELLLYSSELEN